MAITARNNRTPAPAKQITMAGPEVPTYGPASTQALRSACLANYWRIVWLVVNPKQAIVLVAAGSGSRLGMGVPKAQVRIGDATILEHALRACLASRIDAHVCVVLPPGDDTLRAVVDHSGGPSVTVVEGGVTRQASVRAGLSTLPSTVRYVLVHDAARALTPPEVFRRVLQTLMDGAEAVTPGVAVADTIKSVSDGWVAATPARAGLRAIQTPQGFTLQLLRRVHSETSDADITDDAMLVESLGVPVRVVEGHPEAFKVTTPLDLMLAEALVRRAREHAGEQQ